MESESYDVTNDPFSEPTNHHSNVIYQLYIVQGLAVSGVAGAAIYKFCFIRLSDKMKTSRLTLGSAH